MKGMRLKIIWLAIEFCQNLGRVSINIKDASNVLTFLTEVHLKAYFMYRSKDYCRFHNMINIVYCGVSKMSLFLQTMTSRFLSCAQMKITYDLVHVHGVLNNWETEFIPIYNQQRTVIIKEVLENDFNSQRAKN